MRFKSFIWVSGLALLVFISVQYYIISETFETKQEQFDSKYTGLAKVGLYEYESMYFFNQTDSLFGLIDNYAYHILYDRGVAVLHEIPDSLKIEVHYMVKEWLKASEMGKNYLEEYFSSMQAQTPFSTHKVIRNLTLIPYGQQLTFYADTTRNHPDHHPDALKISSYTIERNNYRLSFDYYLDFPERSEKILNEMRLTLFLVLLTLIMVFGVFFLTLRNLFIQKRLSDMKTDFINNMTHELKTPLSTISVASSSLALQPGNISQEKIGEISNTINRQNKHLTNMIDRILDISVWEKDQVKLIRKEVSITKLMEECVSNFAAGNPLEIRLNVDGVTKDHQWLDEIHFTTVINNLLSNAAKYGGNPPLADITVKTNEYLVINIKDNGNGIPKEDQKHIFEKFYRSKSVKKDAIKGLGLGLYYVKQIVEAHSGSVNIASASGKGSVFTIEIPIDNERIAG